MHEELMSNKKKIETMQQWQAYLQALQISRGIDWLGVFNPAGMEYGMERWIGTMENGTMNMHMQLQLTGAAQSRLNYFVYL